MRVNQPSKLALTSLHASIVEPLAKRIDGPEAAGKAALITVNVPGFATLRFALTSPAVEDSNRDVLTKGWLGRSRIALPAKLVATPELSSPPTF
jgi:hypothetical protein